MKTRAFIYIILAGILWGTSGLFVHFLAPMGFSSLQMTAMRGIVAFLCMLVFAALKNREIFKVSRRELALFAASGLGIFGTATSYYASMQLTTVSTAVVLMYTAPIIVMIYSVLFLGEKMTVLKGVAVGAMLVGCCLVSGIIGGMKFHALGIAMGFLSGISYSAYNIFTKVQMRGNSHPLSATLYCFMFMAIFSVLSCKPLEAANIIYNNLGVSIPLLIGIGIATCVLPYFLYTLALKVLPAGTASALGIVEPMAATVFSVLFLQEELSVYSVCGIVLILGAVFLLSQNRE